MCVSVYAYTYPPHAYYSYTLQMIKQWRVRFLVEARAIAFLLLICFDYKLPRFAVSMSPVLKDVFFIINHTLCPLIMVLASRVLPHA